MLALPGFTTANFDVLPIGDLVFDGTRVISPVETFDDMTFSRTRQLVSWATGMGSATTVSALSGRVSLATSATRLYALEAGGLWDVALNPTFSSSTSRRSLVETFSSSQLSVAMDSGGQPRLVVRHGSDLESVWAGPDGFWRRLELGGIDTGWVDVDVDAANDTRACFVRAGRLMVY
jgi:hypothetical protein